MMWIQIGGAAVLALLAIAEAAGLKAPTFGSAWGPWVLAGACAVMLFEAWRTRRKMQKLPDEAAITTDDSKLKKKEETA